MGSFLTGTHPEHGRLWAAVDPLAHHLTGRVSERRFAAFCAPFKSEKEAAAALQKAGAALDPPSAKRRPGK